MLDRPQCCAHQCAVSTVTRAKEKLVGPIIGEGAKIGANATILPAVKIGENALVGAGAVVTKDVAPGKVVAGNPAVIINEISELST